MIKIINKKDFNLSNDFQKKYPNINNIESLIARNEIFNITDKLIKTDNNWKPIFENGLFWSISHKKDLVFIWMSNSNIWLDIEIIKERWDEIFSLHSTDEYKLIWWKNLENFYHLWTLKESVIKLNLDTIDNLSKIKILKIQNEENIINWIKFKYKSEWSFFWKKFKCFNWIDWAIVYSIAFYL